jgi:hypothetical protein
MTDSRVFPPNEIENDSCYENFCFVADTGLQGYSASRFDCQDKMVHQHGLTLQICTDLVFSFSHFLLDVHNWFFI